MPATSQNETGKYTTSLRRTTSSVLWLLCVPSSFSRLLSKIARIIDEIRENNVVTEAVNDFKFIDWICWNNLYVTDEKDNSKTGVAMVELADVVVQGFHHVEVDGGTYPGKTQLQPKHKIQLLALEPEHCVVVLRHCQRFATNSMWKKLIFANWRFVGNIPKNESTNDHEPELVQNTSKGKHQLANHYQDWIKCCAKSDTEYPTIFIIIGKQNLKHEIYIKLIFNGLRDNVIFTCRWGILPQSIKSH